MRYLLVCLIMVCSLSQGAAQAPLTEAAMQLNATNQANRMSEALVKKDYKGLAAYTYPAVVNMMGGADKMADYMKTAMAGMAEQGFAITKISVDSCSKIITAGKLMQCTLTQHIYMSHTDGKLLQKSTLVGVSSDNGVNWTFIDAHGGSLEKLQQVIPELSNQLVIPEATEPEIIGDGE